IMTSRIVNIRIAVYQCRRRNLEHDAVDDHLPLLIHSPANQSSALQGNDTGKDLRSFFDDNNLISTKESISLQSFNPYHS
ncbi:MAG TPA: hypothetical protein VLL97_09795, partial [Acidobacteriota bacterium]|nr:hypothetical protein [Acidobacteriota bacterium]